MNRIIALARALALIWLATLVSTAASAEPADIDAAARGVVRVVIVQIDGEQVIPLSHGTGFAVSAERIVTNAHVIREAQEDETLAIAIVPSDGEDAVYARLVLANLRTDLALLETTSPLRLPPLTVAGNPSESGAVVAIGYPMNVDRAQGLAIDDIFKAQPPVKSTGFLSGRRPTRDFDSLLHTAPIARGNSGGPLVDECGRVIGVNSFGAESGGSDAEFFFAVSNRELLTFLREGEVTPAVNGMPCRSLAELDAEDRARADRTQREAQAAAAAGEQVTARRRTDALREAEFAVLTERDEGLLATMLLLMGALAASGLAVHAHHTELRHNAEVGFGVAAVAVIAAILAWDSRPGFERIAERAEAILTSEADAAEGDQAAIAAAGDLVCVLDPARSRVTGAAASDVPFKWSAGGCVNDRTQYGANDGAWARVFVPQSEPAVSVNRFDPAAREYRVERYLLGRAGLSRARVARGEFQAPACGAGEAAAREFGAQQAAILSLLPERPNERLVYTCSPSG